MSVNWKARREARRQATPSSVVELGQVKRIEPVTPCSRCGHLHKEHTRGWQCQVCPADPKIRCDRFIQQDTPCYECGHHFAVHHQGDQRYKCIIKSCDCVVFV